MSSYPTQKRATPRSSASTSPRTHQPQPYQHLHQQLTAAEYILRPKLTRALEQQQKGDRGSYRRDEITDAILTLELNSPHLRHLTYRGGVDIGKVYPTWADHSYFTYPVLCKSQSTSFAEDVDFSKCKFAHHLMEVAINHVAKKCGWTMDDIKRASTQAGVYNFILYRELPRELTDKDGADADAIRYSQMKRVVVMDAVHALGYSIDPNTYDVCYEEVVSGQVDAPSQWSVVRDPAMSVKMAASLTQCMEVMNIVSMRKEWRKLAIRESLPTQRLYKTTLEEMPDWTPPHGYPVDKTNLSHEQYQGYKQWFNRHERKNALIAMQVKKESDKGNAV